MQTKKALVTGGAGLIGSSIVESLCDGRDGLRADEVVVLDNFTRGRRENLGPALEGGRVTIVEGDIRDPDVVARAMRDCELVFHQAAIRITQCAVEPRLAFEVLAGGTFNVLEAAVRAGVKKVLAASSASIYGMADRFPTDESHPPYNNRTIYGAAKAFDEGLLRSFHEMYGLDYVALRPFNVYGPRMDAHGAFTEVMIRWMERLADGKAPPIFGDGTQTMDFVYVEDVARAYVLAAQAAVTDEVCNIASGAETSLNELALLLAKVMGSELRPEYGPERKVNAVRRRIADVSKAKRLFGWEPRVGLEDGLGRLVAWWRAGRREALAVKDAR